MVMRMLLLFKVVGVVKFGFKCLCIERLLRWVV